MRIRVTLAVMSFVAVLLSVIVLLVTDDWTRAGVTLCTGLVVVSLAAVLLMNRATNQQLGLTRRRVRATLRLVESADKAHARYATRDQIGSLVRHQVQGQRQLREEGAELSRQLAATRAELLELMAVSAEQIALLRESVEPSDGAADAPRAGVGHPVESNRVVGEELFEHLVLNGEQPSVVLALDSFTTGQLFAGVRTALVVGARLAHDLDRPLRVVVMRQPAASRAEVEGLLAEWLADEIGMPEQATGLRLSMPDSPDQDGHHEGDVWVATYWATAHAVAGAVRRGVVRRDQVVYLVQDFEPGFFPWGTQHAMARSTYDQEFHVLVNSAPLARFLEEQTDLQVGRSAVFAPQVDRDRLRTAAARWMPNEDPSRPRLFFYARPSKPRNLYALGLAAIEAWLRTVPVDVRPVVTVAGEELEPFALEGADVVVKGKLSLDEYYDLLTGQDMALALMHSPHPSHLPLELPMSGIPTVTNAFGDYREAWVHGLYVADETPDALAAALEQARVQSARLRFHAPQDLPVELGVPLPVAIDDVLANLRGAGVVR